MCCRVPSLFVALIHQLFNFVFLYVVIAYLFGFLFWFLSNIGMLARCAVMLLFVSPQAGRSQ